MIILELIDTIPYSDYVSITITPSSGRRLYIKKIQSSCPSSTSQIKAEVFWNSELIYAAHGNWSKELNDNEYLYELVGDGSKVLEIKITNDTTSDETCECCIIGKDYE